ncbi:branched-chain-amino-acid aminotransferase 2, chloroplastic [Malania oleifera]|uniref:branched-chain-amino-acid aminotransferase 2, chloroplastic n=1 Tax=Malania oleifera TaxID=397392 RepID=UPI0025AE12A8|nr:branched-chain-amino-acid aminotransferase 2, chloroplastic [Malania oleifera]
MIRRRTVVGLRCLINSPRGPSSFSSKVGALNYFTSRGAASSVQEACKPSTYRDAEYATDVDWDNLGFGVKPTDYMYIMKCSEYEPFQQGQLSRFGNIELSPYAGVLNYGQGLLEGIKAYRREEGGLFLFRPEQNAIRMKFGAERMCMPSPSIDQFIYAIKSTAIANKRWVPPPGKGTLYIRPLLIGSGPVLGLSPAPEYTFLTYASPVGKYFKLDSASLNLYVEDEFHRASRGGVGNVKTISNYAPGLKPQARAKNRGFSDVLYLDSVNNKYIEEVSASNIFIVKDKVLSTPAIRGTILPGITRNSIVEIARDHGYQVEERSVSVDELLVADEVFCTGTAVGVATVGSVTYHDKRTEYRMGARPVHKELLSTLVGIQTGHIEDKKGWIIEID